MKDLDLILMNAGSVIPIQIKATKDGFTLVPDPEASFDALLSFMEQKLMESQDFFYRAQMTLDLRARPLNTDEIAILNSFLTERARVKLIEVKLADNLCFVLDRPPSPARSQPREVVTVADEDAPLIVRNTCRSGTRIECQSDCIILGDVNPGAEIVAVGDVIVFGNLRGIAHAGASGDRSARIWALSIEPSQIRIADLVALAPRSDRHVPKRFEIAEVQQDLIEVITM
jgi:septum site-determining protein MinC